MAREMPRITVTLPPDLVDEIRAQVGPRETSAWVARAITEYLARERLAAAVAEYEAETGPISEEDIAAANKRTAWKPPRRRRSPAA
jgi:Arc/MetJ-type ribon-helix-helix transcriptional regulator